jgi:hypothetical protein
MSKAAISVRIFGFDLLGLAPPMLVAFAAFDLGGAIWTPFGPGRP